MDIMDINPVVESTGKMKITRFVQSSYFTVKKWDLGCCVRMKQNHSFQLVSVIAGSGSLANEDARYTLIKGDHFMLPSGFGEFELDGNAELRKIH
jgi:mannose-6-phosphate isomerase